MCETYLHRAEGFIASPPDRRWDGLNDDQIRIFPDAIFWRLVLAHFIADFTLQTNKRGQWKRVSRWGMIVHVLCHPLMYLLFCWNFFRPGLGCICMA